MFPGNIRSPLFFLSMAAIICLLEGCATSGYATRWGTGLGALTGAVVGHGLSGSPEGAVVGALTGAVAGNLIGQTEDAHRERDVALTHAALSEARHAQALHNYDLIRMTQTGIHEEVIVNAILTQGGDFQLKPEDIITLKNNGVTDRVIIAAQHAPRPNPRAVVVAHREPEVVVVERSPHIYFGPPPPPGVHFSFGSHRHRHCR